MVWFTDKKQDQKSQNRWQYSFAAIKHKFISTAKTPSLHENDIQLFDKILTYADLIWRLHLPFAIIRSWASFPQQDGAAACVAR